MPSVFLDVVPYESAFLWRNDPKIYRWCRQATTITYGQHQEYWQKVDSDPSKQFYGIYHMTTTKTTPIGVCGFTSINGIIRSAEFSMYIATAHQSKGYAKEALVELFSRGFYELGLNKIWGETFEDNPAMMLFNWLGMRKDGLLRDAYFKNGKYCNAYVISILRREWDEHHPDQYRDRVLNNPERYALSYREEHG